MSTNFESLGLSAELLRAVAEQGYTQPTPIQAQAIPMVLSGRDLLGAAQTGTGKTAGFTLPILHLLSTRAATSQAKKPVRALILTPTRELTAQVHDSVRTYGKHVKLRSTVVFGGVGFNPQVVELRRGVDILVATPGRLLDHVQQRTVDLRGVEILVLDEADRMLDMGFLPDIRRILALLPKERQNLLFSATFSDEIRKLSSTFLKDPASIEVARRNAPIELVTQVVHPVDKDRKRELLAHLVKTNNWFQVLVFTKTKHGANRLAEQLGRDGIESDAIHGNKSQSQRTRALKRFKDNQVQVLVATDIAARGIDIAALPHVVNFDLPNVAEDYVHRIGRTGRAGSSGEAISLVSREDRPLMTAIERLMKKEVARIIVPGFELGSASQRPASEQDRDERPARQSRPPQRNEQRRPGRSGGQQQRGSRSESNGNSNGNGNSRRPSQPQQRQAQPQQRPAQRSEQQSEERQPANFESRLHERATRPERHNAQPRPQQPGQKRRWQDAPALFGARKTA